MYRQPRGQPGRRLARRDDDDAVEPHTLVPALSVQHVMLRARSERSLGIRAHGETFAPTGTRKAHCFLVVGKLGQAKGGAEWNARVARRRAEVEYVIDRDQPV